MQVAWLPRFFLGPHNGGQLWDVVHTHNVNIIFAAKSLDEGEVDLEGNVPFVLLISGQHTKGDSIWVAAEERAKGENRLGTDFPKQAEHVAVGKAATLDPLCPDPRAGQGGR